MPGQNTSSTPSSPFEVVTPGKSKKIGKKGIIVAISVVVFLLIAVFLGVALVRQNQNIQEKAGAAKTCPEIQGCPTSKNPNLLSNCTPPETGNNPTDSLCNQAGRTEPCGGKQYCCPAAGGTWTADLSKCAASPTATATATAAASSTATATATATATGSAKASATATAKATSSSTAPPVPVTGTDWPTYAGLGVGIFVIIGSLLLAL
ncbi:MAG: hypothetical protein ACHQUA_01930 [Microgenomates group bacterium]